MISVKCGDDMLICGARTLGGRRDLFISGGVFKNPGQSIPEGVPRIKADAFFVLPGLVDCHVHFREPGFEYKATVASESAAAAAGGYTDVCTMPNLNPTPDSLEHLAPQLDAIASCHGVRVHPFGSITVGEKGAALSDFAALAPHVCGFSDDGRPVRDAAMLHDAMQAARELGKTLSCHCEDLSLIPQGAPIHAGRKAIEFGLPGIPSESEWKVVERDISLVRDTHCKYHVCHVSTKESVDLVRAAKADGLPVSCETAPHYLALCEDDIAEDHGRFKMNPPLRSAADRDALVEGLADGTVDCIATDHAPHSADEKSRGLAKSLFGVVGLEVALPVLYDRLVLSGKVPFETIVKALTVNPRRIFGLPDASFDEGATANLTIFDPTAKYKVDPSSFFSAGTATPFAGADATGRVVATICNGTFTYNGME